MTYTTEQLEQMLSAATPGPWETRGSKVGGDKASAGYLTTICDAARGGGLHARQISNAALIAAAPTITAELIAARRKLDAVTWQPIETAPKDGAPFLGCDADFTYVAIWDIGNRVHLTDTGRGFCYPTHWMPLPAPPEATP